MGKIIHKVREETGVIVQELGHDEVLSRFIVGMKFLKDEETENSLHDLTISIADNSHALFPNLSKYSTQGIGHDIGNIPLPYDPTIKNMIPSAFVDKRLVKINSTYINYVKWSERVDTWTEHVNSIVKLRNETADALNILKNSLVDYFKKNKSISLLGWKKLTQTLWDEIAIKTGRPSALPKVAVDVWGYVSEGNKKSPHHEEISSNSKPAAYKNKDRNKNASEVILHQYEPYLKSKGDYFSAINNFFNQSALILTVHGLTGRTSNDKKKIIITTAEELSKYSAHSVQLTLNNLNTAWSNLNSMQKEFRNKFIDFIDEETLLKLEAKENEIYPVTWALWYQFSHNPSGKWQKANIYSLSYLKQYWNSVKEPLLEAIKETKHINWVAKILSENQIWNEKPSLWLSIDCSDLENIERNIEELVRLIQCSIGEHNQNSLTSFLFERNWGHIIVIPLVNGEAIDNLAWCLASFYFLTEEDVFSDDHVWLKQLLPIEEKLIQNFGLNQGKLSLLGSSIKKLDETFSELCLLLKHIGSFEKEIERLDELGENILKNYIEQHQPNILKLNNKAEILIEDIESKIDKNSISNDLGEVITLCKNSLLIGNDDTDNKITIDLTYCQKWSEEVEEAILSLKKAGWLGYFADT